MNEYWKDRGFPWEYDPGPQRNRSWAQLFAETPNYRGLGKALLGKEGFRWHFGPMFYRGRLQDNSVKVLLIGQEGAQDESLAHRSFTGGTGARMQHFLNYVGITRSYLFLNTFVYPIFGQYDGPELRWLAQDAESPIVKHRNEIFNYVLERNDVHLVIAVGVAAKESVVTWVKSRGGNCLQGSQDVSLCTGGVLDAHTHLIGVQHPGAAGQGGSVSAIIADFKKALAKIKQWMDADPTWLLPDADGLRQFNQTYKYRSAPIPFRDFPFGIPLRLGRGGTSSNRKDQQRSIQLFSEDGAYNNSGDAISYPNTALGSQEGYSDDAGDLPYEPPKVAFQEYDDGPGDNFAKLLMGAENNLEWPDFQALGAPGHPSFGVGPIFRGRPGQAYVLILADQQSHDDLFTGRALTGESGQHMQAFLEAMGIRSAYLILRVLPVDTLSLSANQVTAIVNNPQVGLVYQAIVDRVIAENAGLGLVLAIGPHAQTLLQNLNIGSLPQVSLKAWKQAGSLQDWQQKLLDVRQINYPREITNPAFTYDGHRGQIPRVDLPYGTLRWLGTSGNRTVQALIANSQVASSDYFKLFQPQWVFKLQPQPLTADDQDAVDHVSP